MNDLRQKPSIVIVSSSNTKPKSLIKLITRATNIPETDPHIISQCWHIDTKYYTAEVTIHGITEHYIRNDEFNRNVEALIIHMDSNKESGLQDLKKWESIEKECDPEIKLLISNYCTSDTKVTKSKAVEWCMKRGYEFIELYPNVQETLGDQQEDEIIPEKVGVERVVEALQTHMWPSLKLKDEKNQCKAETKNLEDLKRSNSAMSAGVTGLLLEDIMKDDTDDFMELFTQLHTMKESIRCMPFMERKQRAEQIVTAFWRAIDGEEEEIADL